MCVYKKPKEVKEHIHKIDKMHNMLWSLWPIFVGPRSTEHAEHA